MSSQNRLKRLGGNPVLTAATRVYTCVAPGLSGAGNIRLPDARVGDVVLSAWKLNGTAASVIAHLTATLTVADVVAQDATDLSADVILFVIKRGA